MNKLVCARVALRPPTMVDTCVVQLTIYRRPTEAQFVSAPAFIVCHRLVTPGAPQVTPAGRPMIVAPPTPERPRRGGKHFFRKSRARWFVAFSVIYREKCRITKNHARDKIGVCDARGTVGFCRVTIRCVKGCRLWVCGERRVCSWCFIVRRCICSAFGSAFVVWDWVDGHWFDFVKARGSRPR